MTQPKKKRRNKSKSSRPVKGHTRLLPPSPKLVAHLEEAEWLLEQKEWREAYDLLYRLHQKYPRQPGPIVELMNLAHDTQNMHIYQIYAEKLVELVPDEPNGLSSLGGVYMANMLPWLALVTFRRLVTEFPDYEKAPDVSTTIASLEAMLAEVTAEAGLDESIGLDVFVLNDRMRASLSNSDLQEVRRLAIKLLDLAPDFIPCLNNLGQAEFFLNNTDRSIELAERVLTLQADNFQALSNLTRYYHLTGDSERANQRLGRLLHATSDDVDIWVKKVEALAFMDRHKEILDIAEQAEAAGYFKQSYVNPLVYHLKGFAAARMGNLRLAERSWQAALKIQPNYSLAAENLADLKMPVGERSGAWPFPLESWLSNNAITELRALPFDDRSKNRVGRIHRGIERIVKKYPDILSRIPFLLERGDPESRQLATGLALAVDTPEMRQALHNFVTGPDGPDSLRTNIGHAMSNEGKLPPGMLSMWIEGEEREILLLTFEIIYEPLDILPPEVAPLYVEAIEASRRKQLDRAEELLMEAIKLAPDQPSLWNNLTNIYQLQGREEESLAMLNHLNTEFPDYFFGIVNTANLAILNREYEQAHTILKGLLHRRRLHISEYDAMARAFVDLFVGMENLDAAQAWMKMWESITSDHPAQDLLRREIARLERRPRFRGKS
jgi:tetratricopeptide (TPR) repeat protein